MATKKPEQTEQDIIQNSFELWKKYTQSYADFAMEAMQEAVEQGANIREQMDKAMADAFKKAQELSEKEQDMLMEMTEKFQEQFRTASERVSKIYSSEE
jgi:hypothetical protein